MSTSNQAVQTISPLRQRMIDDMRMRKLSPKTQAAYIRAVRKLRALPGRSPDTATPEDLRRYQLHLVDQRHFADLAQRDDHRAEVLLRSHARSRRADGKMQPVRVPRTLPVVLSREEVARLIAAAGNLKHQTALSVAYGAGLRASEVVALKVGDIDSQRMTLRIEQGKGRKDRYAMLSPVLLERLRAWWRVARAQGKMLDGGWLFPGLDPIDPLTHPPAQPGHPCRRGGGRNRQARVDAHAAPQLRHPPAGAEGRHPRDPGAARAQEARDHRALYPGGHRPAARGGQSAGDSAPHVTRRGRPALEVADIFRAHGPRWRQAQHGHLSLGQLKVMSAIEQCRSAALGGHVLRCDACEQVRDRLQLLSQPALPEVPGERRAPLARGAAGRSAAGASITTWCSRCRRRSAQIAYYNKAVIYGLLFEVAAETLRTIAADPKHLGAQIGATLVLHTWGSALTHHPHVHGIVPGGGLSPDGERWVACRPGFFLPVRVLSRLFRRRFLEELDRAYRAGQLQFFGEHAALAEPAPSPHGSRRSANRNGSSMPSARLPAPRRCWPICPATPTGWRSRTGGWSPWTSVASPSAGRTTAPRAQRATRP